jgi:hypothetical protein
LFGSDRRSLEPVRAPLIELQERRCFYCQSSLTVSRTDVDHFIPWTRHPDDALYNLVAADKNCNNAKRDSLADTNHLARWLSRFQSGSPSNRALVAISYRTHWPLSPRHTLGAARSNYSWQPDGASLWSSGAIYEPADHRIIQRLLAVQV